jgi:hypothetical protein
MTTKPDKALQKKAEAESMENEKSALCCNRTLANQPHISLMRPELGGAFSLFCPAPDQALLF